MLLVTKKLTETLEICRRVRLLCVISVMWSFLRSRVWSVPRGAPGPDDGLDVMQLVSCGFCDRPSFIEIRSVLTNELAETESGASKPPYLEEHVCAARQALKSLREARAPINKLTAERASLAVGTE